MLSLVLLLLAPLVLIVVSVGFALLRRRRQSAPRGPAVTGSGRVQWGTPFLRSCPDCAEFVLREAQVCKYCGCWLLVDPADIKSDPHRPT